jgi:hypothetical protein
MGFLGNQSIELLLGNNSIMINISSLDHLLESVIVSELSEVFCDFSEVFKSDKSGLLGVESNKDFVDLISSLIVSRSGSHHVEKLRELNLTTSI